MEVQGNFIVLMRTMTTCLAVMFPYWALDWAILPPVQPSASFCAIRVDIRHKRPKAEHKRRRMVAGKVPS